MKLNYMTLQRRVHGVKSQREANKDKSWLIRGETDTVIDFIVEMGNQGWPLSHRRLKEHVDEICSARLGAEFPKAGVGKNWTHRFAIKHCDRIKVTLSRGLEEKCARGVNYHTDAAYWDLLRNVLTEHDIEPENMYGVDEIGVQSEGGKECEWVFGARKSGLQYQQQSGSRENITVLVTICADGTATPPAVIFKGSAYQVKWKQNNPVNTW